MTNSCKSFESKFFNKQITRNSIALLIIMIICAIIGITLKVEHVGSIIAIVFSSLSLCGISLPLVLDIKYLKKNIDKIESKKFLKDMSEFTASTIVVNCVLLLCGIAFLFI